MLTATILRLVRLSLALFLGLFLTACANMQMTNSGGLSTYSNLKSATDKEVTFIPDEVMYYSKPGIDWASKGPLKIAPVTYNATPNARHVPKPQAQANLAAFWEEKLKQELNDSMLTTGAAGSGMTLRAMITDVNPESVLANIVGVVVAFPVDMGGVSGELEIVDDATGEQLMAMTATREGTPLLLFEAFSKYGHAKHGMKKWSHVVRRELDGTAAGTVAN